MSHKEFVLAYENGNIGCGVSIWMTGWLFIGDKIRQKKLSSRLFFWSVSFPVVMTGSGFGFLNFRFFWAILETVVTWVLWTFPSFYWVAAFVLSTALDSEEFYEFAQANRVLWVYPGDDVLTALGKSCRLLVTPVDPNARKVRPGLPFSKPRVELTCEGHVLDRRFTSEADLRKYLKDARRVSVIYTLTPSTQVSVA